jgi:hypothetical protein
MQRINGTVYEVASCYANEHNEANLGRGRIAATVQW